MKVSKSVMAAIVAASLLPLAAMATTSTSTFQVSATVSSSCSMTTSNLSFGTYDPLAVLATAATTSVSVTCNLLTPYTVALDGGSTAASISARAMTDGSGHNLPYQLYSDATHLTVFGDGTTGSTVAGTGTGLAVGTTVYGQIAAGQSVPNGSYADTITVTLTF